jgi:hypothetical protein
MTHIIQIREPKPGTLGNMNRSQIGGYLRCLPGNGQLQSVRSRRLPTAWCVSASIAYGVRSRLTILNARNYTRCGLVSCEGWIAAK